MHTHDSFRPRGRWQDRVDDDLPGGAPGADDFADVVNDAFEMAATALRFGWDRARSAMSDALRDHPRMRGFVHCEDHGATRSRWTRHYSDDATAGDI